MQHPFPAGPLVGVADAPSPGWWSVVLPAGHLVGVAGTVQFQAG